MHFYYTKLPLCYNFLHTPSFEDWGVLFGGFFFKRDSTIGVDCSGSELPAFAIPTSLSGSACCRGYFDRVFGDALVFFVGPPSPFLRCFLDAVTISQRKIGDSSFARSAMRCTTSTPYCATDSRSSCSCELLGSSVTCKVVLSFNGGIDVPSKPSVG